MKRVDPSPPATSCTASNHQNMSKAKKETTSNNTTPAGEAAPQNPQSAAWEPRSPSHVLVGASGKVPDSLDAFEYIKPCGTGTFGEVGLYEFKDKKKTKVAIKKVFQNPSYKNREFAIQSRLDHANIVKVLVPGGMYTPSKSQPGANYLHIVMEAFDKSLYTVIHRARRDHRELDHRKIQNYTRQMLQGLAYLGRKNIAHRDLKPENVLLKYHRMQDGLIYTRVAICDFGNAKVLKGGDESICYICTRMYRAPELVYGSVQYRHTVDMWSIGCILAEMGLSTPLFGMTMEQPLTRDGEVPAKAKPLDLWRDFARCLGMPTEQDWIDMNLPRGHKEFFQKQARLYFGSEYFKGVGVEITLRRIYMESSRAGKTPQIRSEKGDKLLNAVDFDTLFPDSFLDLIEKMLTYSPLKRITVAEALNHPYFSEKY